MLDVHIQRSNRHSVAAPVAIGEIRASSMGYEIRGGVRHVYRISETEGTSAVKLVFKERYPKEGA